MWDVCVEFISFFLISRVSKPASFSQDEPQTISEMIRTFSREELRNGQQVRPDYR